MHTVCLFLSCVLALAGCSSDDSGCHVDDLRCLLTDLNVITPGGSFAELVPVPADAMPAPDASNSLFLTDATTSAVIEGRNTAHVEASWDNSHGGQPGMCLRLCATGGGDCTDFRCQRGSTGSSTSGLWVGFLGFKRAVRSGVGTLLVEIWPVADPDGNEPVAELETGTATVVVGTPVPVNLTVYSAADGDVGCPSPYDGTYIGMFEYEYETSIGVMTQTAIQLTVTMECLATVGDSTTLTITDVLASEPALGCTQGCAAAAGSVAVLPSEPPTTPSNPSLSGHGIVVAFPNGATMNAPTARGDNMGVGEMTVTTDGLTLTNSTDPSIADDTWQVRLGDGSCFPNDDARSCRLPGSSFDSRYIRWNLDRSNL